MKKPSKKFPLEKARSTFWLLGLCVTLFGVYGLFELKSYPSQHTFPTPKNNNAVEEFAIPPTHRKPLKKQNNKKEIKKIQKKLLGQEYKIVNDSSLTTIEYTDTVLYEVAEWKEEVEVLEIDINQLDKKPVFPGCEDVLDEQERFQCFQQKLMAYVQRNFKPCQTPFGTTKEKLFVKFTIDENGVSGTPKILRGQEPCNMDEAKKLIVDLPKMKAGMYRDKYVKTTFVLPINIK